MYGTITFLTCLHILMHQLVYEQNGDKDFLNVSLYLQ